MSSDPIMLPGVRLSFPQLWTPRAFEQGQQPRFEGTFMLDVTNPAHLAAIEKFGVVAAELQAAHYAESGRPVPSDFQYCWGDGNNKVDKRPEYAGHWYIATANRDRPLVIDADKTPLVEADGRPYAGCFVNASISLWLQDNKWGRRINANLRAVQFVRDGEAFSSSNPATTDEFDVVEGVTRSFPSAPAALAAAPAGGTPVAPGVPAAAPTAPAAPAAPVAPMAAPAAPGAAVGPGAPVAPPAPGQ